MITRHLLTASIILLSAAYVVHGQWQRTNGPQETRYVVPTVRALATDGDYLFAGTDRGVFRSSNNGSYWAAAGPGITDAVNCMTVSGDGNLCVGTSSGVYVSVDEGIRWRHVSTVATSCFAFTAGTLFAGTDSGVYRSRNYGLTWEAATNSGLASRALGSLPPGSLIATGGRLYVLVAGTLYSSTNDGDAWRALDSADRFAAHGDTIVAGTSRWPVETSGTFGTLSRSTDGGMTWRDAGPLPRRVVKGYSHGSPSIYFESQFYSFNAFAAGGTTFLAALSYGDNPTIEGIFVSTDDGASWSQAISNVNYSGRISSFVARGNLQIGLESPQLFLSADDGVHWKTSATLPGRTIGCAMIDRGKLFAAIDSGLVLSLDSGASWKDVSIRLPYMFTHDVQAVLASGGNLLAATLDSGLFLSSDNGASWAAVRDGLPATALITASAVSAKQLVIADGSSLYRSTDNGASWSGMNSPAAFTITALAFSGSTLYAGATNFLTGVQDSIFRSTDNGVTWSTFGYGYPVNSSVLSLMASGTSIFAGTGFGVYRMTGGNGNWGAVNSGLPFFHDGFCTARVSALVADGTDLFAGMDGSTWSDGGGGVYRSTNNGGSWDVMNNGLPDVAAVIVFAVADTSLVAVVNGTPYVTIDQGADWTAMRDGLPATPIAFNTITVNGAQLVAGTTAGVWRADLSRLQSSVPGHPGMIDHPSLLSSPPLVAIPNPAHDALRVVYDASNAQIELYDLFGKRVMTAHGDDTGVVKLDVGELPEGTYILRLRAGAATATQRVVIVH
jgi:photosystem II stability/assembly factor-like uncharacterized protein